MNALLSRCASLRWLPRNLKPGQMIALCALAAAGLGMLLIATKLLPRPASMEQTGDVLLACCLLAAAGTFLYSCAANSLRWAAGFFVIAVSLGLLAEIAGMRLPVFGSKYRYHPVLESSAVAGIPLFVPLAWYFLSHQALMTMRPILNRCGRGSHTGTAASALVLCGYDLMLDPIATELALWTWLEPGAFFGVPVLNSLGWFAVGLGIFSLARAISRPLAKHPGRPFTWRWMLSQR